MVDAVGMELTGQVELPTEHIPTRREAAQKKFAALLDDATANL